MLRVRIKQSGISTPALCTALCPEPKCRPECSKASCNKLEGAKSVSCSTSRKAQLEWLERELADREVVTLFDTDEAGDKYRAKVASLGLTLTQVKLPESVKDIDEYLHGESPLPLDELVRQFTQVEPTQTEAEQAADLLPEQITVEPRRQIVGTQFNDSANAQRLVELHGHDLRFVPEFGSFLHFNGTHWTHDDLTPLDGQVGR